MPKNSLNVSLKGADDIFSTEESRQEQQREQVQQLSLTEQMEEYLFLGLRLTAGIAVQDFYDTFHYELEQIYGEVIEKHREEGLLAYTDRQGGRYLHLTERGLDLANYVMADFLEPQLPG